jgi:hypothetical protein
MTIRILRELWRLCREIALASMITSYLPPCALPGAGVVVGFDFLSESLPP